MDSVTLFRFQHPVAVADATRVAIAPPQHTAPAPTASFIANSSLHNVWSGISMPADATRVAPRPVVAEQQPQPVRHHRQQQPIAVADATRVVIHPRAERKPQIPEQPQMYFRAAEPGAIERARAQENVDQTCALDPTAAEINGYRDFGFNGRPSWQKVGASPLEYTAAIAQPELFGAINSARGISEAIHHPSAVNVTLAAVGTGSLLLGGMTRVPGLPHAVHQVAEGAERVHYGMNFIEAGGTLDRVKESMNGE